MIQGVALDMTFVIFVAQRLVRIEKGRLYNARCLSLPSKTLEVWTCASAEQRSFRWQGSTADTDTLEKTSRVGHGFDRLRARRRRSPISVRMATSLAHAATPPNSRTSG